MANESLAVSSRRRNSILGIVSTNINYLHSNYTNTDGFIPYSFHELSTLVGLAFTAILAEGSAVNLRQFDLNIFLKYRDTIPHQDTLDIVTCSIVQLFQSGLSSFKVLGYPYYYDDFILAYHYLLNSANHVPLKIKQEMQQILRTVF